MFDAKLEFFLERFFRVEQKEAITLLVRTTTTVVVVVRCRCREGEEEEEKEEALCFVCEKALVSNEAKTLF